jgi:hypothetical protein
MGQTHSKVSLVYQPILNLKCFGLLASDMLCIRHKRGTFAMGGMSASITIKNDPQANAAAMATVEADKLREVRAGHGGT